MHMNLGGKVEFVIVDVLGNLLVALVSKNLDDIPTWTWKVDEYIIVVFDFAKKFLAFNGLSCYFTHMTSNFKEVKFYQGNYGFQIWMKWIVVNSLPFKSNDNPFFMVPS